MFLIAEMLPSSSALSLSSQSFSGKLICSILGIISIFSWSVLITKLMDLLKALRESKRFIAAYRSEPNPLSLFLKMKSYPSSPLQGIYGGTCKSVVSALESSGVDKSGLRTKIGTPELQCLNERQVGCVLNMAESTMADMALKLDSNMVFLATAASTAPYLGLLGTVWGVMEAFNSISTFGQALLSEVAPGIAGALLTTVVGLIVALPSSLGYNCASAMIKKLRVQMDNFVREMISDVELSFREE